MKFPDELTDWLCLTQTGAALHAHLKGVCRERYCALCDHPLGVINEDLPCPHWLIAPYAKPERLKSVFANFAVAEVVRYVLIWTLSETRRHSARNLRCASRHDATEILIGFRNRSWRFLLEGEHAGTFEYSSCRTGFTFRLPLTLQTGEASELGQLLRLGANESEKS
jgi:hypothetical protein